MGERRMTSQQTIAKTQERDAGGLDQGESSGGGEEIQAPGQRSNGMLTGLADGLDVGCESKAGVKDKSKVSGLNNWKRFANKGGEWGKL